MDEDPRLTELEIDVVTITRDESGLVTVDGGGLALDSLIFLLRAGEYVALSDHFYPEEPDDDDEG